MANVEEGTPQVAQSINPQPEPAEAVNAKTTALPKLSAAEFREYNRMADHMDLFVGRKHPSPAAKLISYPAQSLSSHMEHHV